ncbi:MAG: IS66 family transposase [Isosphaeraceae bacterium]
MVVYILDPSRSHEVPQTHFPEQARGVLLVDRYSAYKAMAQVKDGGLVLAFCWTHVRRDFVRVGKGWPELKPWALAWLRRIRDLYAANRRRLNAPGDVSADQ